MASQSLGPHRGRPRIFVRGRSATLAAMLSGTAMVAGGAAYAQEVAEEVIESSGDDVIQLDAIRIHGASVVGPDSSIVAGFTSTGSKTPAAVIDIPAQVSIVTAKEIQTRDPDNLMEALSYMSSVSVDEYGSDNRYDWVRIRGFNQTGTGTYRDGLPLRTFNFTGGSIEPYSVERIEVLKGSTSTLFGMNGPGGLINVITKRPQQLAFGEVYTTVGTDNHLEGGFDFGNPLDDESVWTYRITGKIQNADQDTEYQNDDRKYLAVALSWNPTEFTSLTLLASYYDLDGNTGNSIPVGSTASRDTFFGEPDFAAMDRQERSLGYEFSHDFGNGLTFRQNARKSSIDMLYQQAYLDSSSPTGRYAYEMEGSIDRFAIDNQLQYDVSFGNVASRTLFGIDYTDDDLYEQTWQGLAGPVDPNNPVPCGMSCIVLYPGTLTDMTQKSTGIYLQEELTFYDRWILTLGGRYDDVDTDVEGGVGSNTQNAFTKRFGLTYKATPDLSFYANYSESFDPLGAGYVPYISASAEPQRGDQKEIGVKYRPAGADALVTFALFDLTQTNVPRFENFVYSQIGEVNVKGAELEGRMALNDQVNLLFAWSYWDAKIVGGALNGNVPQLTPEYLASAWVDYTFADPTPVAGLKIGGGVRYLGSRYADDANTAKIGSAVLFDAMTSYPVADNTELALNVSNLFDKEYISTLSFDQTSIYYGQGRSVKLTLRHVW